MRRPSAVLSTALRLDAGFGSAGMAALSASADDFFLEGNNLSLAATSTRTFQATDYYRSAGQPRVAVPTWFVERNLEAHRELRTGELREFVEA